MKLCHPIHSFLSLFSCLLTNGFNTGWHTAPSHPHPSCLSLNVRPRPRRSLSWSKVSTRLRFTRYWSNLTTRSLATFLFPMASSSLNIPTQRSPSRPLARLPFVVHSSSLGCSRGQRASEFLQHQLHHHPVRELPCLPVRSTTGG